MDCRTHPYFKYHKSVGKQAYVESTEYNIETKIE